MRNSSKTQQKIQKQERRNAARSISYEIESSYTEEDLRKIINSKTNNTETGDKVQRILEQEGNHA